MLSQNFDSQSTGLFFPRHSGIAQRYGWALENNLADQRMARQNSSSLQALPLLSADAEEDKVLFGYNLLVQNHRARSLCQGPTPSALYALLVTATSPWAPASLFTTEPHLAAPLWTHTIVYTFFTSLPELKTPRSCYKGKGRSLPTAFEKDTNEPDDNEAQGFSVATLGRTSR